MARKVNEKLAMQSKNEHLICIAYSNFACKLYTP